MIVGIGIDIVSIQRILDIYQRHADRFVRRILTDSEKEYVLRHKDPGQRLAGRWAAKEAALKALGTGLSNGIRWRDVEILPDRTGKPYVAFHGRAHEHAAGLGATVFHVTITHSDEWALAQVILEKV